jgi:hypothetical protein
VTADEQSDKADDPGCELSICENASYARGVRRHGELCLRIRAPFGGDLTYDMRTADGSGGPFVRVSTSGLLLLKHAPHFFGNSA